MPLYEYTCQTCHADFELLVRGDELLACPECESSAIEKRFSVPAAARSSSLPISQSSSDETCGRPQCGRGCQFE